MSEMTILFSTSKRSNPLLLWFRANILKQSATHVAFGIEKDGQPIVFHMSGKGAVRTPRDVFNKKNFVIQEFQILPDLSKELGAHLKYLGAKYDQNSATWHFIALLFRPLKQFLIFFKIRNAFYCANFARQLDRDNRLISWRKIDKRWASVDELQRACQESSEFCEI